MRFKLAMLTLAFFSCPALAEKSIEYSTLLTENVSAYDTQPNIEILCSPSNKLNYFVSKFLPISSKYSEYTVEYHQNTDIACEGMDMPIRRYHGNQPTFTSENVQHTIAENSPDLIIINRVFKDLAKIGASTSSSLLFTNKLRTTMMYGGILKNEYATEAGISCQENNLYTIKDYSSQKTMDTKWQCPYSERDYISVTRQVMPLNEEGRQITRFALRFNSFENYARAWRNISNTPL